MNSAPVFSDNGVNQGVDALCWSQSRIGTMDQDTMEQAQANICKQYGQQFLACPIDSILGVAVQTLGNQPLHGLRHKPKADTNGWYIWAGEYSSASDFF